MVAYHNATSGYNFTFVYFQVKLAKDKSGTDESSTSEAPTPTPGPRAPSEPPQGQPSAAPIPGGPPESEGGDKQAGTEQVGGIRLCLVCFGVGHFWNELVNQA